MVSNIFYAAFGLTLLPYLVMSVVNLVGNLVTPTYPTLYMVDSYELEGYYSEIAAQHGERKRNPRSQGPLAILAVGRIIQENKDKSPLLTGRIVEESGDFFLQVISGCSGNASSDGPNPAGMAVDDEVPASTSRENSRYRLAWHNDLFEMAEDAIVVPASINFL
jgi:hypothetical protein